MLRLLRQGPDLDDSGGAFLRAQSLSSKAYEATEPECHVTGSKQEEGGLFYSTSQFNDFLLCLLNTRRA